MGQQGPVGAKNWLFSKNDHRPCTTLKQMFLDRFDLVVAHFGPPEILKWAVLGPKMGQKWVKNAFFQT